MNTHKANPFQKWEYEQSEHISKRRERGDEVTATQTSYYILSKLVTAGTVIFVSRSGRGSHSSAKEVLWELLALRRAERKSTAAQCQSYGGNLEHRTAQKALQVVSTLWEPKTFSSCKLLAAFRLTQLPVL